MSTHEELERKINKLDSQSKIRFSLEVVIIPILLLGIGYLFNQNLQIKDQMHEATLQNQKLTQDKYDLSSKLIPMILDSVDSKKTYFTFLLFNKVDTAFADEIKPLLFQWKLNNIITCINNKNIKGATKELDIAESMGGEVGKEVYKTFRESTDERFKMARIKLDELVAFNEVEDNGKLNDLKMVEEKVFTMLEADRVVKSEKTQETADKIMNSSIETQKSPKPAIQASFGNKKRGWLFLGTFDQNANNWVTHYLEEIDKLRPEELKDKSFRILKGSSSNIRVGKPTEYGEFLPVIEALKTGKEVKILDVEPWSSSNYMWARIEY